MFLPAGKSTKSLFWFCFCESCSLWIASGHSVELTPLKVSSMVVGSSVSTTATNAASIILHQSDIQSVRMSSCSLRSFRFFVNSHLQIFSIAVFWCFVVVFSFAVLCVPYWSFKSLKVILYTILLFDIKFVFREDNITTLEHLFCLWALEFESIVICRIPNKDTQNRFSVELVFTV